MRSVQKNLYLLIILLISFPLNVLAQNKTITGTVRDVNDVVIGASVTVKGQSSVGTITDMDGNYTLSVPASAKELTFSYIGYETQTVAIKGRTQINVTLKESSQMLEEVVAIGYAKVKRKDLTGSSVSVGANDLKMSPVSTAAQALAGKAAGVNIVQQSGAPGSEINITVRGGTSITQGTQPLYIVDGFQMENGLQNVDINDIESIDVMKDASATAVYGVRGANGVILVTTKRGTVEKLKITARANFTISQLKRLPKYLRAYDYAKLANEARVVSGEKELYSPMEMDLIQYQLDPDLYPDVNWQDEILHKTSFQQTYYVSAQGGGSIARYFVSMGMSKESAAYIQDPDSRYKADTGYNTYNYRTNLDINVTKSTTLYLGLDGFISNKKEPGMANTDLLWNAQSMLTPLTIPTRFSTGQLPAYGVNDAYSPYVIREWLPARLTKIW